MEPKIALIIVCTGPDYWKFLPTLLGSAKIFLQADVLLFTDSPIKHDVAKQVSVEHKEWPYITLMRFHTFLSEKEWLSSYDYVFYIDADMKFAANLGSDLFSDGITACLHSAFIGKKGTPEEDPKSTSCLSEQDIREYYTGCFFGGKASSFLAMAEEISKNIDIDNSNNFIAKWHDESHLNRYLYDHPPAKALGDDYNAWYQKPTTKVLRVYKNTKDRPAVNGKQPVVTGTRVDRRRFR